MAIKPLSTAVDLATPSDVDTASIVSVINTNNTAVRLLIAEASAVTVWIAAGERVSIEKTPAVVISADDGAPTPTAVTAATVFASKIAYGN
ncbi:hypothetical protein BOW91_gp150 [Synechococcus phage S-WAM2]|uniref:Uncharacterized protein n=1 Tax=Synechococcus phage S-WAM2 TaxID=1815522 RepID=A0A1D8KT28_9CAUD|nr:hypothetical protein BOW91_gp150 [Synechococcus phage S-WAM2]AOV61796.1 hypothetical protein P29B0810_101 [Synechococcus phage S-WAM2]